jgi:Fe2+ transport system protein B
VFQRFADDVFRADNERVEFLRQLDCVKALKGTLDECIEAEKNQPGHAWVKALIPNDPKKSPLLGLQKTMDDMVALLQLKETALKQKLKNFKWHSEKKSLEGFFTAIATYCTTILGILNAANFGLSRDTNTIVRGIVVSLEQGWEDQKKLQEERKVRQEEKKKYQEQKMKFREQERKRIEEERRLLDEERRAQQEERKQREEEHRKAEEESDRKLIQPWLSALDFHARQRTIFEQSYRTGQWFLQLPAFEYWKQGQINVLRCYGMVSISRNVPSLLAQFFESLLITRYAGPAGAGKVCA